MSDLTPNNKSDARRISSKRNSFGWMYVVCACVPSVAFGVLMTAEAGDTYFYTISMIDMANNVEGHVEEESLPILAGLKK